MSIIFTDDPSGSSPNNRVTGEAQSVTRFYGQYGAMVIPEYAPFFANQLNVYIRDLAGERIDLQEGIDYNLIMPYIQGMNVIGAALYGAISFLKQDCPNEVFIDYQVLGSGYGISRYQFLEDVANRLWNPRMIYWDTVMKVPTCQPPEPHPQDAALLYGADSVVEALYAIADAINNQAIVNQRLTAIESRLNIGP